MLKAKSREKFSKSRPKLGKFWRFWGSGDQGVQKVSTFTPNGTCVCESTSFEPFCVKIGREVCTSGSDGEKNKVRDSIGKTCRR